MSGDKKPFLSDIKTLREKARQSIDKGAVTPELPGRR